MAIPDEIITEELADAYVYLELEPYAVVIQTESGRWAPYNLGPEWLGRVQGVNRDRQQLSLEVDLNLSGTYRRARILVDRILAGWVCTPDDLMGLFQGLVNEGWLSPQVQDAVIERLRLKRLRSAPPAPPKQ